MHTSIIVPIRVNIGNRPQNEAQMKGCQVRDWIVAERDTPFSRILYVTCVETKSKHSVYKICKTWIK